jgi:hypothetical protein
MPHTRKPEDRNAVAVRVVYPNAIRVFRKLARRGWFTLWIEADGERLSARFDYKGGFQRAQAEAAAWEHTARCLPLLIPPEATTVQGDATGTALAAQVGAA